MQFLGSPTAPLRGRINFAASGDNSVLSNVSGQKHRVYAFRLSVAGATVITLKDSSAAVFEKWNFAGNGGGVVLDLRELPYWVMSTNTDLVLNSSNAVQVDGQIEYTTAP